MAWISCKQEPCKEKIDKSLSSHVEHELVHAAGCVLADASYKHEEEYLSGTRFSSNHSLT